ncbi:carbamoyltransferase HypF [Streptomyces sp. NBC_00151]|uniref:carbamoyltransferase HypF n=1 Tax=Streptomyces sp. NBC_00151 TaxID=2975669 RepID=UPI002DDA579B|nr:carbamoyltransferase HypF [Streptomyces sp. NBC_00151]WRZ43229.1 carbamoyltransferase HypF [Streptomyces sp. NBC_00151]
MKRAPGRERRHISVTGVVQGVGFRPFVYTLAQELGLTGWVTNNARGVEAEVEGPAADVAEFCARIGTRPPPLAVVESVEHRAVPLENDGSVFTIRPSSGGPGRTLVSPDTATCDDCLRELADPADRRYRHPFITCTHCGPRFTIVTSLPYDRDSTTMAGFPMCADCAREYADPADRRFHAQPIACPACGPRLTLRTGADDPGELRDGEALAEARRLLAEGAVVAVKGLGGYHLACDAGDPAAVRTLRKRKNRGGKPFAVLAGSLETVRRLAHVGPAEEELLLGPRKPVVLLRRREGAGEEIAAGVAPGSPDLGFMLPYTPVHRLLLGLPGDRPGPAVLVMTSGNRSGEPIVTDDAEALTRLAGLADAWLAHDRPVHVPCDDSVVRVCAGAELPVRRSRGYAPFPIALPVPVVPALAVGGDLKNTFCAGDGRYAWLSAHVGDMDDLATLNAFERATGHLTDLTAVAPRLLVADRHPGYRATLWARRTAEARGLTLRQVQHHHAHVASAMAEHGLDGSEPVIGVAFDGTGYGDDGAVWGGEVLLADYDGYRRFAHLGYVPLPGGDAAVRNPYRMALSHLRAAGLPWRDELPCAAAATPEERRLLERQLERGFNCVPTSSMGRLFDAVSSLAGVCHRVEYEAQAAMELENAALDDLSGPLADDERNDAYRFMLRAVRQDPEAPLVADPAPVLAAAVADVRAGVTAGRVARRFHRAVVGLVLEVCAVARESTGIRTVALSGGVFCNALLTEGCGAVLERDGFTVLRHHRVPPNDGGLALGQLIVAARTRD